MLFDLKTDPLEQKDLAASQATRARELGSKLDGYLDSRGHMDWSVAIRTAVMEAGTVRYGSGGGIVWDSVPQKEYEELLVKAGPIQAALTDSFSDARRVISGG